MLIILTHSLTICYARCVTSRRRRPPGRQTGRVVGRQGRRPAGLLAGQAPQARSHYIGVANYIGVFKLCIYVIYIYTVTPKARRQYMTYSQFGVHYYYINDHRPTIAA